MNMVGTEDDDIAIDCDRKTGFFNILMRLLPKRRCHSQEGDEMFDKAVQEFNEYTEEYIARTKDVVPTLISEDYNAHIGVWTIVFSSGDCILLDNLIYDIRCPICGSRIPFLKHDYKKADKVIIDACTQCEYCVHRECRKPVHLDCVHYRNGGYPKYNSAEIRYCPKCGIQYRKEVEYHKDFQGESDCTIVTLSHIIDCCHIWPHRPQHGV